MDSIGCRYQNVEEIEETDCEVEGEVEGGGEGRDEKEEGSGVQEGG